MKKYKCTICGHIYDEAVEGVKFEDLPDDWVCPLCMAPKSMFVLIEDTPNDNTEFNKSLDNKKENNYINYLPGINCGGCGYGSCEGMCKAIEEDFENYKKCRVLRGEKLEKFLKECKKDA